MNLLFGSIKLGNRNIFHGPLPTRTLRDDYDAASKAQFFRWDRPGLPEQYTLERSLPLPYMKRS